MTTHPIFNPDNPPLYIAIEHYADGDITSEIRIAASLADTLDCMDNDFVVAVIGLEGGRYTDETEYCCNEWVRRHPKRDLLEWESLPVIVQDHGTSDEIDRLRAIYDAENALADWADAKRDMLAAE